MNGQFTPDLSDHLLVVDARVSLNLALDANDDRALANWARQWGAAALEGCGGGESEAEEDLLEEIDDLEGELAGKEEEIAELKREAINLEKERDGLQNRLTEAGL